MRIGESTWIGPLTRGLEFDKTSECMVDRNGVVGTEREVFKRRLSDEDDVVACGERSHILQESFERSAELVFRIAARSYIGQLCSGRRAKARYRRLHRHAASIHQMILSKQCGIALSICHNDPEQLVTTNSA